MTDTSPPDIASCFCLSMRQASNRLVKVYTVALAPCGLKPSEFALLAEISRRRNPTLIELADVMQFDRYTLRYKLAPLEAAGLVEVTADRRDARSRRAALSEAGLAKFAEATPLWREAQARVERALKAGEAATLRTSVRRLATKSMPETATGAI